jgi:hypothetical protein
MIDTEIHYIRDYTTKHPVVRNTDIINAYCKETANSAMFDQEFGRCVLEKACISYKKREIRLFRPSQHRYIRLNVYTFGDYVLKSRTDVEAYFCKCNPQYITVEERHKQVEVTRRIKHDTNMEAIDVHFDDILDDD